MIRIAKRRFGEGGPESFFVRWYYALMERLPGQVLTINLIFANARSLSAFSCLSGNFNAPQIAFKAPFFSDPTLTLHQ
jgi:hypothetical protein